MALGNLLRRGAALADTAGDAISKQTTALKDKASGLKGDQKDEVVFDGAIDMVQDALIDSSLMSAEINAVLKALKDGNPYR